ncbi:MAG: hypothetical protein AAFP02_22295 [Bacteroidota bacterium]
MNLKSLLPYLHFGYFILLLVVPMSATYYADETQDGWRNQYIWNSADYATVFIPCILVWVVVPFLKSNALRRILMVISCLLAAATMAFFVTLLIFPIPLTDWGPMLGFLLIPGLFILTIWLTIKNWRVEN